MSEFKHGDKVTVDGTDCIYVGPNPLEPGHSVVVGESSGYAYTDKDSDITRRADPEPAKGQVWASNDGGDMTVLSAAGGFVVYDWTDKDAVHLARTVENFKAAHTYVSG